MDRERRAGRIGPSVVGRKRKLRSLSQIMEETAGTRKWGELEMDCLINMFGRIGMESLLLSVPFVCKSWHKATLDPMCWQHLSFPEFLPLLKPKIHGPEPFYYKFVRKFIVKKKNANFSIDKFVKWIVTRSDGKAVEIKLPGFIKQDTLRYVSESCPQLRVLGLPDDLPIFQNSRVIPELIENWKLLEQLHLGGNLKKIDAFRAKLDRQRTDELFEMGGIRMCEKLLIPILKQIGIHCMNFIGLSIANDVYFDEEKASTIVEWLPYIKYLWFQDSIFEGDSLITLVKGCKKLEILDGSNCVFVEGSGGETGDTEEIAKLAKDYGVEFLWHGGGEDGDCYDVNSASRSRKLLVHKIGRSPRMSCGGVAPRKQLASL